MTEYINVDVNILSIKESKETVKLGETRDIMTILYLPFGHPPQRLVIPTNEFSNKELTRRIALRIKELRDIKPVSMMVKVPLEETEEAEE